jgi:hypothetical protein
MSTRFRLFAAGVLCAGAALAQSTLATITGMVADQEGAAVPKVAIEAVHVQTGYRFTATSNEVGLYTVPQLPQGEYTISAKAAGFQEAVVKDVLLAPRDVRRIDIKLSIAAVQASIEVTAGATLIETETARLADVKSGGLLNALPYGGRGAFMAFQLTPNVTRVNGVYMMRFAGSRLNQSDYSMDGVSFMVASGSNPNAPLTDYTETVEEMRVDVANNTAEFSTVGQVSMISKSGTNQLHGSGFDFYSSPVLRAREPFALARSAGIRHQPGFTLGGPVYLPRVYDGRNRTFFFTSMELGLSSASTPTLAAAVPLKAWRSGDFSGLAGTTILDPMAGRAPFAGNVIPASQLNSVSLKIQEKFYPLPNSGDPNVLSARNFQQVMSLKGTKEWYFTERIDHRISDKIQLTGRMVRHGYNSYRVTSQLGGREITTIKWKTRFYTFSYTHNLRPNLVNEFRVGSSYNVNPRYPVESGLALVKELGLVGLSPNLPDLPGIFNVSFSGLGLTGISNAYQYRDGTGGENLYFQDHLSWFRGRHALKVGGQFNHSGLNDRFLSTNLYGSVTFTNRFTNQPYADFLLGIPSTAARAPENPHEDVKRDSYSAFITDEFRLNNKLTLNLGVRYEYEPGWYGGVIAMFEPTLGKIVVPDDSMKMVSPLVPTSYVEVISASQAGLPKSTLLFGDRNNFAPRIGIAWRPVGPSTVLRAGWGMFYDLVPRNLSTAGGSPYSITEPSYTNPQSAPTVIFPRVFPEAGTGGPTTISIPSATNPHVRTPYSMQHNLTIEHQRWSSGFRISYIGTSTRQGEWGYNMNQPVADTRSFIAKAQTRLFPKYPNIYYYTNGAGHQYHSLTLQMQRRTKGGMFLQTYYTLARDIGDLDRGESPEYAYDRKRERGVWIDIPTHRWNATAAYELPFGKGKRLLSAANRWQNLLVGGWEINGIYTLQSGDFLTPAWSGPDPTGTAYTTSSTPATVTIRPDHLRDANLSKDQRSLNRWFDVSAFAAPQAGSFGTSARGVIKGPGTNIMHATLVKRLHFTERFRMSAELAATNVLNHPNWSAPGTNITSLATAGVITGSSGNASGSLEGSGARNMMVRVRVEF